MNFRGSWRRRDELYAELAAAVVLLGLFVAGVVIGAVFMWCP